MGNIPEMRTICKIWICLLFFACCIPLQAQPQTDSTHIYFQRGYATWNPSFRDNLSVLNQLISTLRGIEKDTSYYTIKLQLKGNASPDGLTSANARLAAKRANTVLKLIKEQTSIPDSFISVTAEGIDWNGLIALVESDRACPAQQEVLQILRNTPEWIYDDQNRIVDGRKKQLMDLQGGVPYNYMLEKLFPELRNTTLTLRYKEEKTDFSKNRNTDADIAVKASDSTSDLTQNVPTEHITHETDSIETTATPIPPSTDLSSDHTPLHRIALKTNLLYDAILMPALEVEYRIDDRWSVAVEGSVAWWKRDAQHKYYQIATIIPEGRYWFKTKKPWHGHYVGLFAGGSWYDLENGARGYKGEFYTTGISYGYMFPIGRSLSLETGIGVGFLHTVYEEYLPIYGHYVYQQTSRTNWIGPVKIKFAFVWRLWDQNKNRGGDAR